MTKTQLIEDIRREFTSKELFYAVLAVNRRHYERDISQLYCLPPEPATEAEEACVDKVLRLGKLHQLKGLRETALELRRGTLQ
jgi:hypothetical protein